MFGAGLRDRKPLPFRDKEASTCGIEMLTKQIEGSCNLRGNNRHHTGRPKLKKLFSSPRHPVLTSCPSGSGGRGHEPSHCPCVLCSPVVSRDCLCGLLCACSQVADGSAGFWSLPVLLPPLLPRPAGAVQLQTPGF